MGCIVCTRVWYVPLQEPSWYELVSNDSDIITLTFTLSVQSMYIPPPIALAGLLPAQELKEAGELKSSLQA